REEERNAELAGMLKQLRDSRDQIHRQNKELQVLATRDPLTKAYNRRSFFEQLRNLWAAAVRYDHSLCCIMLDLDHFKSINDNYGHACGDAVLRDVASVLNRSTRHSDILCRYGGEEFCILVPHIEFTQAEIFAENLRKAIESCDVRGLKIYASIGVSSIDHADSPERLIDQADQALYHAKNSGRNQVVCWCGELGEGETREVPISISEEDTDPSSPIPFQTVSALTSALAYRDPSTAEHSRRVADMCVKVATEIMPLSETYILENAALMHDIGKIGVPDSILLKPGQLSEEEWIVMRNHDRIGQEIIRSTFGCDELADIVKSLHDWHNAWREDDTPDRSLATQSVSTKILAIADSYDAMVTDRVYRAGRSQQDAFAELRRCAGTQFDGELVEHFINVMSSPGATNSDTNVVNKQVAIRLGVQIESLARALDEKDVQALATLTAELRETTAASHVAEIAKLADELNLLATSDSAWVECLEVTLELLDICRKTQRMHLDDSARALT
ncbi:MAG: diguanylate cyclase, partial [Planctomycetota bacterium]